LDRRRHRPWRIHSLPFDSWRLTRLGSALDRARLAARLRLDRRRRRGGWRARTWHFPALDFLPPFLARFGPRFDCARRRCGGGLDRWRRRRLRAHFRPTLVRPTGARRFLQPRARIEPPLRPAIVVAPRLRRCRPRRRDSGRRRRGRCRHIAVELGPANVQL
jgi:hypothetical protein